MTAATPRPEKQEKARSRRRAWLAMKILTALCVLAALAIGATQVSDQGLQAFVTRPEGVGATPDAGEEAPTAPAPPTPQPDEQPRHEHDHDHHGGRRHHHDRDEDRDFRE